MVPASLYTSCTELLGKNRDHKSFRRLAEKVKEEPVLAMENDHVVYYDFQGSGIQLVYKKSRSYFGWIWFFIDNPKVTQGDMRRYQGDFLSGVTPDDSVQAAEQKIDAVATRQQFPNECTLSYNLAEQKVTFFFDGPGRQMRFVLVELKGAGKKET